MADVAVVGGEVLAELICQNGKHLGEALTQLQPVARRGAAVVEAGHQQIIRRDVAADGARLAESRRRLLEGSRVLALVRRGVRRHHHRDGVAPRLQLGAGRVGQDAHVHLSRVVERGLWPQLGSGRRRIRFNRGYWCRISGLGCGVSRRKVPILVLAHFFVLHH